MGPNRRSSRCLREIGVCGKMQSGSRSRDANRAENSPGQRFQWFSSKLLKRKVFLRVMNAPSSSAKALFLILSSVPIWWLCSDGIVAPAFGQGSGTNASASGKFDGPAELPRIYVDSSLRSTPAPGKLLTVRAGEDPSRALSKASCGDTVQLQAGATFNKLVLPEKSCDDSHWIIVRTSAPDSKL